MSPGNMSQGKGFGFTRLCFSPRQHHLAGARGMISRHLLLVRRRDHVGAHQGNAGAGRRRGRSPPSGGIGTGGRGFGVILRAAAGGAYSVLPPPASVSAAVPACADLSRSASAVRTSSKLGLSLSA